MSGEYYMVVDNQQAGPFSFEELIGNPRLTRETLIWKPGLENWIPAHQLPELDSFFQRASAYGSHRQQEPPQYNHYQGGYHPQIRTNWLPWAIVATVLGFFTSCIGAIFGIIGIIQANKANTYYAQNFEREGDMANSNAKIMTIIGLVFAAIGICIGVLYSSMLASLFSMSL